MSGLNRASPSLLSSRLRLLSDPDGRPDRHQFRQLADVPVRHADAAVRWAARDELGLVRAVDSHDAAARPVGQLVRVSRRAERPRAVDRAAAEVREPLADPEAAARRRRPRLPDADARRPDPTPALAQRRLQQPAIDREMRADGLEVRELLLAHPALATVGPAGDADLQPHAVVLVELRAQHDVDLRVAVLRVPA